MRRPLQLVAAGLVLVATTDITYVGRALEGRYVTGTWLDGGWACGFLLVAASAYTARGQHAERPVSRTAKRVQLLLPYVPVALAVTVTGLDLWQGQGTDPLVMALVLVVVVVASVRQGLTLAQNADLIDELATREVDLRRRALEDPLTGLGNRTLLLERLESALADQDGPAVSLLYLDLDDFKLINDTHGHDVGDLVLAEVGRRLAALAGPGETVARLAGDEFAVLLRGRSGEDLAAAVADALRDPVRVGARRFAVHGSIGLVRAEADETAGTLLAHGDIAMYAAKGAGKGQVVAVHGADRAKTVRRTQLREMVARPDVADFRVVYQPVVDVRDGQVRGVEALVRWHPPEVGEVSPVEFIHLAEQAGTIGVIGLHVLRTALRDLAGWQAAHPHRRFAVGVNVSPLQLADDDLSRRSCTSWRCTGWRRASSCWRSPRRPWSGTSTGPGRPSRGCASSASASRSTTSGPATPPSATSTGSRPTCSRSTGPSSRRSPRATAPASSSARSPGSAACWTCRRSRRAWSGSRTCGCCRRWASSWPRATCSRGRWASRRSTRS